MPLNPIYQSIHLSFFLTSTFLSFYLYDYIDITVVAFLTILYVYMQLRSGWFSQRSECGMQSAFLRLCVTIIMNVVTWSHLQNC